MCSRIVRTVTRRLDRFVPGDAQTTWCSQRTGAPSPAYRKAPVRRPTACPGAWRSPPPGRSRRRGRASAARSRSSGIRMSPWMPVTAWKMPSRGCSCSARPRRWCGLRGDLEAQRCQPRSAEASLEAVPTSPFQENSERQVPGAGGLPDPVEADAHAEHAGDRPLDVRAQRARRGVHVQNSTCREASRGPPVCLPASRFAFPSGLERRCHAVTCDGCVLVRSIVGYDGAQRQPMSPTRPRSVWTGQGS